MVERMPVLLVDDDEAIRESLGAVLEDLGCRVSTAKDGKEALAHLRDAASRPCLILLDLMMPVMSGWQFLEARERDAALTSIPVVVMTASNVKPAAVSNIEVLRKPLTYEQLVAAIELYVRAHAPVA